MNIGEASRMTGLPAKTIRYYESIGLVDPAERTPSGYRVYRTRDLNSLRFIHRARSLGFSIEDVASLLDLWNDRHRTSAQVRSLAQRHLESIEQKMDELGRLRDTLSHLLENCHGDQRPDCPIIRELASGASGAPDGHISTGKLAKG